MKTLKMFALNIKKKWVFMTVSRLFGCKNNRIPPAIKKKMDLEAAKYSSFCIVMFSAGFMSGLFFIDVFKHTATQKKSGELKFSQERLEEAIEAANQLRP